VEGFVDFGEFAGNDYLAVWAEYAPHLREGFEDSVWGFVKCDGSFFVKNGFEKCLASLFCRYETEVEEFVHWEAGAHEGGEESGWAGDWDHFNVGGECGLDE